MTPNENAKPSDAPIEYILNASCRAGIGIVAAVATFLAQRDCYICALEQFDDDSTERFFMRAVFRRQAGSPAIGEIRARFAELVAAPLRMDWKIHDPAKPVNTVIMVSKDDHCLDDLLYRRRNGELRFRERFELGKRHGEFGVDARFGRDHRCCHRGDPPPRQVRTAALTRF